MTKSRFMAATALALLLGCSPTASAYVTGISDNLPLSPLRPEFYHDEIWCASKPFWKFESTPNNIVEKGKNLEYQVPRFLRPHNDVACLDNFLPYETQEVSAR